MLRSSLQMLLGTIAFLISTQLLFPAAVAQRPVSMPIEDAIATHSLGELSPLALSPDGTLLAYMVQDARRVGLSRSTNEEEDYLRTGVLPRNAASDIWITNLETERSWGISDGSGANWQPTWSPDGKLLAFLSDRDGSGQAKLWVWDAATNTARLLCGVPVRATAVINELEWTPDSKRILVATLPQNLDIEDFVERVLPHGSSGPKVAPGARVTLYEANSAAGDHRSGSDEILFNQGFTYLHDLSLVDVCTGQTTTLVHGRMMGRYSLSSDGTLIAYSVPKGRSDAKSFRQYFDLMALNIVSRQERVLASGIMLGIFSWSPDGSYVAYSGDGADENTYDYYIVATAGGIPRKVSALQREAVCCRPQMPMWDLAGKNFYFVSGGAVWRGSVASAQAIEVGRIADRAITGVVSQRGGVAWLVDEGKAVVVLAHDDVRKQDGFYKIELATGKSTKLLERGECYSCKRSYLTSVSARAQRVAYIAQDARHPPDLWVSGASFQAPQQVTNLNTQFGRYPMGSAQLISWLSSDGEQLSGGLLLPPGYQPGKRYPLLVWVYPLPALSNDVDKFGFGEYPGPFNVQLFASRGYAVFLPDARQPVGDRVRGLAGSILPGVNKVIDMGIADPERIGIMGHSQGGYAVLALLVQSSRFKWAITADGWSDYTSYYGILRSDGTGYEFGQAERQLGGAPWEVPLRYVANSPIYFLDKINTPLLIVHGSDDPDHPAYLADQLFVGLRRLKKNVQYAKYDGESHAPRDWSYENQVDLAKRILDWMARYTPEEGSVVSRTSH